MATLSHEYQQEWHKNHPGYHNRHHVSIISELGGVCKNCGETEKEFLTIDHVSDDGFIQRNQLHSNSVIYRQILSDIQSGKFQILCFNCNIVKALAPIQRFNFVEGGKECKSCDRSLSSDAFRKRDGGRWLRTTCKDCESDSRRLVKVQVFALFGNVCTCCSEKRTECLSLDHVEEDGSRLREEGIHATGYNLYRRILNGTVSADGLQLMCFNCNFSKHIGGCCIHRRS